MLTFNQSVLERRVPISGSYSTFPFEAGWASEAVFFIQTEGPHPALRLQPEMSPDGMNWTPMEAASELAANASIRAVRLQNFANWLRLTIEGATQDDPATILVHLSLKG